jgi:S-layer homology domain
MALGTLTTVLSGIIYSPPAAHADQACYIYDDGDIYCPPPDPIRGGFGETPTPVPTDTPTPTNTPAPPPPPPPTQPVSVQPSDDAFTRTSGSSTSSPTGTACSDPNATFDDVPENHTFFLPIKYLVRRGWVTGYNNCTDFLPDNNSTRGQIAKIVANSSGYTPDQKPTTQTFADVTPTDVFYEWIEWLANRGVMGGYACGTTDPNSGPCDAQNRPYFRPLNDTTRGQMAKIVVNAFGFSGNASYYQTFHDVPPGDPFFSYIQEIASRNIVSGYTCGSDPALTCDSSNRPYFKPSNKVTRGQLTKFVYKAFSFNTITNFGLPYDHAGPHGGSNNYECTAYDSSNGCTSGNKTNPVGSLLVNNNTSRGFTNDYNVVARELTWTQKAKDKLVSLNNNDPDVVDAVVFHAFKWNTNQDCTTGQYLGNPISNLPLFNNSTTSGEWRYKPACNFSSDNEARIYLLHPSQIIVGQQYQASVIWSTNTSTLGEWYTGQLAVDNYLLQIGGGFAGDDYNYYKDFMVKFCYQRDTIGECPR